MGAVEATHESKYG